MTRRAGHYGSVTIDYHTEDVSATTSHGADVVFGLESRFNVSSVGGRFTAAHFFTMETVDGHSDEGYLLTGYDQNPSLLYKWMGTFVYIKVCLHWSNKKQQLP